MANTISMAIGTEDLTREEAFKLALDLIYVGVIVVFFTFSLCKEALEDLEKIVHEYGIELDPYSRTVFEDSTRTRRD